MGSGNHWAGVSNHGVSDDWVSDDWVSDDRVGNDRVSNDGVSNLSDRNSDIGSVLRGTGVADVLDDTIAIVSVGDSLDTTIRQVDSVAAGGGVSVSLLCLGEVCPAVVISHPVLVLVDWRLGQITSHVARAGLSHQHSGWQGGDGTEERSSQESLAGSKVK